MSGVELGLAILGTIDLCFKYGNRLIEVCTSFKEAQSDVAECILRIKSLWKRTSLQVEFIRRVWNSLDTEHQAIQNEILQVLNNKLSTAISKIEKVLVMPRATASLEKHQPIGPSAVKRLKYAFAKESLNAVIEDIEKWQKMFDPSWFLMLINSSPQIDTELNAIDGPSSPPALDSLKTLRNTLRGGAPPKESIFLPEDGLKSAYMSAIPFSSARVAQRAGSSQLLILDTVFCATRDNVRQLTANVRELARKLSHADPLKFGLLKCRGIVRTTGVWLPHAIEFTFVFKAISGCSPPRSLRAGLVTSDFNHSLSDRLQIAKDLAKSVSFVHTFGFVHKNIRPENILLSTDDASKLGQSCLVGFQEFRAAEGDTRRSGDDIWVRNLYRHPERQGIKPDEYYIMQHDIYSLGCCLLELGMWQSLVAYDDDENSFPSPLLSPITAESSIWDPIVVKDFLVSLARSTLPRYMGDKYAKVVETCLTCLDEYNVDFGDESEFVDVDGVLVGVRYIEKVLLQLENISI